MKLLICIAVVVLLIGCAPPADTPLTIKTPPTTEENGHIQIIRIGIIADDLAYNSRRGIYILKDTVTGKEYVGVSGIGISELGSHSTGKSTVNHEQ